MTDELTHTDKYTHIQMTNWSQQCLDTAGQDVQRASLSAGL